MKFLNNDYVKPRKIENTKVGDELKFVAFGSVDNNTAVYDKFIVKEVYPFNVLCQNTKTKELTSFTIGDLVMAGKESMYPQGKVIS